MTFATMPDGNTADLRAHEAQQDKFQARADAYKAPAINGIADEILDGRIIRNARPFAPRDLRPADFMEGGEIGSPEDWAAILTGTDEVREKTIDSLRAQLRAAVVDWCQDTPDGQQLIESRIEDMDQPPCRCRGDCYC